MTMETETTSTPERGSEQWHDWRAGLTKEQQGLADQGILLPGNHAEKTSVEIFGKDGTSQTVESKGVIFDGNTIMVPANKEAQRAHGSHVAIPKKRN